MIITKENIDELLSNHGKNLLLAHRNEITEIKHLPKNLEYLDCYGTGVTKLPKLPKGLTILDCASTKITSLPTLPNTLESLYCEDTKVKKLPELPKTLVDLYSANTELPKWQQVTIDSQGGGEYMNEFRKKIEKQVKMKNYIKKL